MPATRVLFEIPAHIQRGLLSGEFVRVGGVIRQADNKQIVAHLREVGEVSQQLGNHPAVAIANIAIGVINLGATIAYGEATQRKLGLLAEQASALKWAVDAGFTKVLDGIGRLEQQRHEDLLVDLKVCAEALASAQRLEPGSVQRVTRLENARERLTAASAKLHAVAEKAASTFAATTTRERFVPVRLLPSARHFLQEAADRPASALTETVVAVRQAALARALHAQLIAETDGVACAQELLANTSDSLYGLEAQVGSLLTEDWGLGCLGPRPAFTAAQTDTWLRRYRGIALAEAIDTAPQDVRELHNEYLRRAGAGLGTVRFDPSISELTVQIEALHEDLDRLRGHALEYGQAAEMGLSIQQYRELLRVDAPDAVGQVVLLQIE